MLNETVIVTAIRNGNVRRAVELMLDSYQDELFGYCARLVGMASATLVYHRVLATAIKELSTFTNKTTVRAWLFEMARRAVVLHHRTYHGYPEADGQDYRPVSGPHNARLQRSRDGRDQEVAAAIKELDPSMREVLQLSLWHGLHLEEVAYVVGCTEAEARNLAARSLLAVASELRLADGAPS